MRHFLSGIGFIFLNLALQAQVVVMPAFQAVQHGAPCPTPTQPMSGTNTPSVDQIIWNWDFMSDATGFKWNTIDDYNSAADLGWSNSFTETGLNCNTPYTRYIWAYNACGKYSVSSALSETTSTCPLPVVACPGTTPITYSGHVYNPILMGSQCWLKQNLNIGMRIDGINDQTNNGIIEKYCYNDHEPNCSTYGGLYQWNEAMQYSSAEGIQGICPDSWHLPTDAEWTTLITFLGGGSVAGGAMKEMGLAHWYSPNTGAYNSGGFTALGSGYRFTNAFYNMNEYETYWSSSETGPSSTEVWCRQLAYMNPITQRNNNGKVLGFPVRCIKDICDLPLSPTEGTHMLSPTQIIWNWNTVTGATGYKGNLTDDYTTSVDLGLSTSFTETGLTASTTYTRYLWAYNGCGFSAPTILNATTSPSSIVTDGLILYLDASNPSSYPGSGSTWSDLSGQGAHATLANGTTWVSNGTSSYFSFDGVDDLAEGVNISQSYQDLMIVMWSEGQTSEDHSEMIFVTGTASIPSSRTTDGIFRHMEPYSTDQFDWNYLMTDRDFVNGTFVSTNPSLIGSWNIAREFRGTTYPFVYCLSTNYIINPACHYRGFKGRIALVLSYNRELTQLEIQQNYNVLKSRFGL